jgi:hypothetical protein
MEEPTGGRVLRLLHGSLGRLRYGFLLRHPHPPGALPGRMGGDEDVLNEADRSQVQQGNPLLARLGLPAQDESVVFLPSIAETKDAVGGEVMPRLPCERGHRRCWR